MGKQSVDALISGGKATAAPPLGPALGPLGVNIGQVVAAINEKTKSFAGMQVPVKVIVDEDTKEFEITIGTPPASALIKQEAGIKKASGNPKDEKVADLKIEQVIKVAQMKSDNLLGKNMIQKVKEICGTCDSMGVMVEGKQARETIADINNGMFVDKIESGKTEITAEEQAQLEKEKAALAEEAKKNHDKYVAEAKSILEQNKNKENKTIRKAMTEAGIPIGIVNEVCPEEKESK